ncbi:MAG: DUF2442 domain-containing protein [Candidatus Kapabacteria bacterium]|nr:DUF2442 domain-containing protein [Candidatus Kapabacteria bacterium]
MHPRIKSFEIIENYKFDIHFQDNKKGVFDLTQFLDKGDFRKLRNPELFNKVKLVDGVLTWFNELDISPDTVYLLSSTTYSERVEKWE